MSSIVINGSFNDDKELKECQVTIASLKSARGFDLDWEPEMYKIPLSGTEMDHYWSADLYTNSFEY